MTDPRRPDRRRSEEGGPDDARLAELFTDAVSDVEPREALDSIRTRTKGTPMSARRPWTYAVGGAVVATAALIAAVAFAGDRLGLTGSGDDGTPAAAHHSRHHGKAHPNRTPDASVSTAGDPSETASPVTTSSTMAGYYLADTPQGTALYREFRKVEAPTLLDGVIPLLISAPHDPDYSTPWRPGDLLSITSAGSRADVEVAPSVAKRPAGMSEQDAREAVQQVVYTVQAALQSRVPVQFSTDTVLGVDTSQPVPNADPLDVLALVSISSPEEGATVSGSFTASGVASSFEANVPWEIRQGDTVVKKGFATAEGWMDKLYPWQTKVDVSGLAPGTYTFVAMTDDPSSGEGGGPYVDTRTITVQ